jgi:hypothetical protein
MAETEYHINDLVASLEAGKAVAFLGSGISLGARLPDWPRLLKDLIALGVEKHRLDQAQADELNAWSAKPDYLMLADAIQRRLTPGLFQDFMVNRFRDSAAPPTELHRTLAMLPFAAFVTTNFDRLFEHAWSAVHGSAIEVITHKDKAALRNPFGSGTPFLMKTHGCVSRPDTLVLGLKEFRESIHDNRACLNLLQRIFLQYQVLFMGHSLTDPDLLFMLDSLVSAYGLPPREHVALIKKEDVGPLRADSFLENYGIRIETYEATTGHPEVLAFVRELLAQLQEKEAELRADLRRRLESEPRQMAVVTTSAPVATTSATFISPSGRYSEPTLAAYCRKHLDTTWANLSEWYDSLHGSPERLLLRVNLDRECEREDLSPEIWQEFLRRLARRNPSAASPLIALKEVVDEDPGLFVLKGRKIEGSFPLFRYLHYEQFARMLEGAEAGTKSASGAALENQLLGRPGHPVWCADGTYASESDPGKIADGLWPSDVPRIVELAYTTDTLLPDNYLRVATVPDIYWSESQYINIKKPAAGTSGWSHTVHLDDDSLRERVPSAVHAPLRLLAARTQTIGLRVIGPPA